jgi:hypothetical protein
MCYVTCSADDLCILVLYLPLYGLRHRRGQTFYKHVAAHMKSMSAYNKREYIYFIS